MIILDTNVISEIIEKQPDEHVANRSEEHTSELQSRYLTLFPYTTLFRSRGNSHYQSEIPPIPDRQYLLNRNRP